MKKPTRSASKTFCSKLASCVDQIFSWSMALLVMDNECTCLPTWRAAPWGRCPHDTSLVQSRRGSGRRHGLPCSISLSSPLLSSPLLMTGGEGRGVRRLEKGEGGAPVAGDGEAETLAWPRRRGGERRIWTEERTERSEASTDVC